MIPVTDKFSKVGRIFDILWNMKSGEFHSYRDLVEYAYGERITGIGVAGLSCGSRAIGLIFLEGIPDRLVFFDDDRRLSTSGLPAEAMQTGHYEFYEILKGDLLSHPADPGSLTGDRNGTDTLNRLKYPMFLQMGDEERINESVKTKRILLLKTDVKGRITYLNRYGCRVFGYGEHEILGKPVIGTIITGSEEKVQTFLEIFKDLCKNPGTIRTLHHDLITREGKTIRIAWSFFAQVDEKRCVDMIFCTGMTPIIGEETESIPEDSGNEFRIDAEQLPIMFFVAQQGKIVHANDMCLQIIGYRLSELTSPGFNLVSLLHPAKRMQREISIRRQLMGTEPGPLEYSIVSRSGERVEILLSTKNIDYTGMNCVLCVLTDITEIKRAEETILKSETLYRTIFDTIGTAAMVVDGFIRLINKEFERIFGYARGDLEGCNIWSDLIVHDESQKIRNYHAMSHSKNERAQDSYELGILDAGGQIRDVIMTVM